MCRPRPERPGRHDQGEQDCEDPEYPGGLGDDTLRRIAELKLACYSNEEIRQQLGCSLRSVTLKLELIRKKWQWVKGPP